MNFKIPKLHPSLFLLLLVVIFTTIVRVRLLDVPLERDEGEYAYMGRLILEGTPPYSEAYNMKFPGIYFIYADILWLFGETHTAIHICLLCINVLSIILLFIFVRAAIDDWAAAAASGAFALLGMSYHVQGFWANAEHFILPFILGAHILLRYGLTENRKALIFSSAALFSCAAIVKQQGAFFGIMGFVIVLISSWKTNRINEKSFWNPVLTFLYGAAIPLTICFVYLLNVGVLQKFYLWTFAYAKEYSVIVPAEDITYYFFSSFLPIWRYTTLIWILAAVGLAALFLHPDYKRHSLHIFGLAAGSMLALSAGFYFRPHYFVLVLPITALLFGIGIRLVYRIFYKSSSLLLRLFTPNFIAVITFFSIIAAHWDILYQYTPEEVTRRVYGSCPFNYSSRIAELIKEKSSEEDKVAIIGNEPQFLFYSQRRSVTSFIYTFSLVEEQPFAEQFRLEMISQIETASPRLLVYTNTVLDYFNKSRGQSELDKWFADYTQLYYDPVARFEYFCDDTLLITDTLQIKEKPASIFWIQIYERKTNE
ncbi:MAG: hypothetical protein JXA06_09735 [Bacteroidetes bacterium]|nr:hypothetical protein [Bacteroidota bacterium]